jgi:hypothetical protein
MKIIKIFSKIAVALIFLVVFVFASGWMVRLWLQSAIPLPMTDGMMDFALELYDYQNQEEVNDALAWLGLAVVMPINGLICFCACLLWRCLRSRHPP